MIPIHFLTQNLPIVLFFDTLYGSWNYEKKKETQWKWFYKKPYI